MLGSFCPRQTRVQNLKGVSCDEKRKRKRGLGSMKRGKGADFYALYPGSSRGNNRTMVLLFSGKKRRTSLTSFHWVFSLIFIVRGGPLLTFAIVHVFSHFSEMAEFSILPTQLLSSAPPRNEVEEIFRVMTWSLVGSTKMWSRIRFPAAAPWRERIILSVSL